MGVIGIAAALGAMSMLGGLPALEPRRVEIAAPSISRDKRKRRGRSFAGGHKFRGSFTPLPYVLHARAGSTDAPLCRPGWIIPFGPHRFPVGREPTCNDCQRAIWKAEHRPGAALGTAGRAVAA